MGQCKELAAVLGERAGFQQLATHGFIDLLAAAIVWGNDEGVLWSCSVVARDRRDALWRIGKLGDPSLLGKQRNSLLCFVRGEVLHGAKQLGVLLPHDGVQLGSLHASFLHLLERSARIDALMLAYVTDDKNAVLRAYLL